MGDTEGDVCTWRVVSKIPAPFFQDMVQGSQCLGVKKLDRRFRGVQMGEWVQLVDEPGYVRLHGSKSGKVLVEKEDDAPSEQNGVEGAYSWRVVSKMPCPVFSDTQDGPSRNFLGSRKAGSIVQGVQEGDWLRLVDEPGFIRIIGMKS